MRSGAGVIQSGTAPTFERFGLGLVRVDLWRATARGQGRQQDSAHEARGA